MSLGNMRLCLKKEKAPGAMKIAQQIKYLLCKHKDLISDPQTSRKRLGAAVGVWSLQHRGAELSGFLGLAG